MSPELMTKTIRISTAMAQSVGVHALKPVHPPLASSEEPVFSRVQLELYLPA